MKQSALDFTAPFQFDPRAMAVAPSEHREARETSALAAIENAALGRKANQNARILALLNAAGKVGLSDLELHRATGYPRSTICARRGFDLKSLIEAAPTRHQDDYTKRSYTRWRVKGTAE